MTWLAFGMMWLARLLFFGAYVLSIVLAFQGRGIVLALIVAIPIIGQVFWFGLYWKAAGFWNLYTILVLCAAGCYGLGALILQRMDVAD